MRFSVFRSLVSIFLLASLVSIPGHIIVRADPKNPYLFKDINIHTSELSKINGLMEYNGLTFYFAHIPEGPGGLWQSDGTPENTHQVKEGIWAAGDTYRSADRWWAVYNGVLYFGGSDQIHGAELWRTDGTADGTYLLKDVATGMQSSNPTGFVEMNGWLYFVASSQLWRTDGTHVEQISGINETTYIWPPLIPYKGMVYFDGYSPAGGNELWRSDGTNAGTQPFTAIFPGQESSSARPLLAYNGWLYFSAADSEHGNELWVTDGTTQGTRLYADMNPAGSSTPSQMMPFDDGVLFAAADNLHGREVWTMLGMDAEGQPVPPTLVSDLVPGSGSSEPILVGITGSKFLFFAKNAGGSYALWALANRISGAMEVKETFPSYSYLYSNQAFPGITAASYQGKLFFEAFDSTHGMELWESDGTSGGTHLAIDLRPGSQDSYPNELTLCGTRLCFPADDGDHGFELWSSDGTTGGTGLVYDLNITHPGSDPQHLTAGSSFFYFIADDGDHGRELWRSDGTPEGTLLVRDIDPTGRCWPPPNVLTLVGSRLYFDACDPEHGIELWATDGQPGIAWRLTDLFPGNANSNPTLLTPVGQRLFFIARSDLEKDGLWVVGQDGIVKSVKQFTNDKVGYRNSLAAFDDRLFFLQVDQTDPYRSSLWRTDGTPWGTKLIFSDLASPGELVVSGSRLFFSGYDLSGQPGLWQTDGTPQTVTRIPVPVGDPAYLKTTYLIDGNGKIFFLLFSKQAIDLYCTNPARDGVLLLKSFSMGEWNPPYQSPMIYAGRLILLMQKPDHNMVTFSSDGTPAGTQPIPGGSGSIDWVTPAGPYLYFAKANPDFGSELWRWDGTQNEPVRVTDFNPGPASSDPASLLAWRQRLYFSANDGLHGAELWAYDVPMQQVFFPVISR